MIINTMSNAEILKEINQDMKEVTKHFAKHYQTCFKRQVLQATAFPFVPPPLHFTSSRKNKYLIYIEAKKRSDWKIAAYYCACRVGNMAYVFDERIKFLYVFIPHFFSRYRERFMKNYEMTTEQVIESFFRHNQIVSCKKGHGVNALMGTCRDGIFFGIYEKNGAIIKTFITRDMQFESQKPLSNDIDKHREELWRRTA